VPRWGHKNFAHGFGSFQWAIYKAIGSNFSVSQYSCISCICATFVCVPHTKRQEANFQLNVASISKSANQTHRQTDRQTDRHGKAAS